MNTIMITFFVIFCITPEKKIIQGPYTVDLNTLKSSIDMIKEIPYQTGIFQYSEKDLIVDNADQIDLNIM